MSSLPELKLSEVLHVLKPIELKYFEVGVQLDVSVETLQVIKEENPTFSLRLCKTIDSWHKNTSSERCTWSTLADAVARVGGHDNLVRELRKRGNNAPVSQQPSEDDNSEDTGYSTKSDSAISDTESSSGSETERFELVAGCGCGKEKPCSLYTLCARGCPNPTRRRIPVLQKKRVGAVSQDDLPFEDEDDGEDFERETKKIQKYFGDFVTDVCCSFRERKVNIETLTLYLQSSFPVMRPRSKELNEATSMEQVFKIVVDQACSWFDYEVIVSIIKKFGESSDKDRAQVYEDEFKKYAKQRLPKGKKHIEIGSRAKVGTKQLVVKIDKEWEEVTFNELDKLRGSFASILGVRRTDLYLADVREGCIMMTFMIQKELAKKLFPRKSCLTAEQIHSLKSESVISVRCGKFSWRSSSRFGNAVIVITRDSYSARNKMDTETVTLASLSKELNEYSVIWKNFGITLGLKTDGPEDSHSVEEKGGRGQPSGKSTSHDQCAQPSRVAPSTSDTSVSSISPSSIFTRYSQPPGSDGHTSCLSSHLTTPSQTHHNPQRLDGDFPMNVQDMELEDQRHYNIPGIPLQSRDPRTRLSRNSRSPLHIRNETSMSLSELDSMSTRYHPSIASRAESSALDDELSLDEFEPRQRSRNTQSPDMRATPSSGYQSQCSSVWSRQQPYKRSRHDTDSSAPPPSLSGLSLVHLPQVGYFLLPQQGTHSPSQLHQVVHQMAPSDLITVHPSSSKLLSSDRDECEDRTVSHGQTRSHEHLQPSVREDHRSKTELRTVVPNELLSPHHCLTDHSRLEGSPGEGERYRRQDTQTPSEAEL